MSKKVLSLFLALLMMLSNVGFIVSFAEEPAISEFSFNLYSESEDSIDTIDWFLRDGIYYMFLPGDADLSNVTVYYKAKDTVSVNGSEIENGSVTDIFNSSDNSYILTCAGQSFNLCVMRSSNIPAVYITTESGSLDYIHADKNNKEAGNIAIYENGVCTLNSELKHIKGRGNTTWKKYKKPYNIKFDKKTSLFGMAKAKKWTLLANEMDASLIRNNAMLGIAQKLPFSFTSKYQNVDLYINNDYKGSYLVIESVEVNSARLDINDLDKANEDANPGLDLDTCEKITEGGLLPGSKKWIDIPNSPKDISGGYLLEINYQTFYGQDDSGFETPHGQNVSIKSPELATKSEVDYISSYFREAEEAVYSPTGYNSLGKHYTDYFDMETLAYMYILEEFSLEWDPAMTSCFMYKESGDDKFYFAPAWDFDMSLGNPGLGSKHKVNLTNANMWFANQNYYYDKVNSDDQSYIDCLFTLLYQNHADFRNEVKAKWSSFKALISNEYIKSVTELGNKLTASAVMNAYRWGKYATKKSYDEKATSYASDVAVVTDFMKKRVSGLDKGYAPNAANLYYDANGGLNKVLDANMYYIGDEVIVKTHTDTDEALKKTNAEFICWNTKKGGNGTNYYPGDTITLSSECTVLYAIWSDTVIEEPEIDNENDCNHICHKSGFLGFIWKIATFFHRLFGISKTCTCGVNHY